METVELSNESYNDLSLLAQAWGVDHSGAVDRLIAAFRTGGSAPKMRSAAATARPVADRVEVYADYGGVRVTGEYDPRTQAIRITSGIKNRRTFKSPSGAAIAVVSELNPTVDPNRNGWSFWNVADTGEILQSIRRG